MGTCLSLPTARCPAAHWCRSWCGQTRGRCGFPRPCIRDHFKHLTNLVHPEYLMDKVVKDREIPEGIPKKPKELLDVYLKALGPRGHQHRHEALGLASSEA